MTRHIDVRRTIVPAVLLGSALLVSLYLASSGPAGAMGAAVLCALAYALGKHNQLHRPWALLPVLLAVIWVEVAVTEVAIRLA